MYEILAVVGLLIFGAAFFHLIGRLVTFYHWLNRKKFFKESFEEEPLPITREKEEKVQKILRSLLDTYRIEIAGISTLRYDSRFSNRYEVWLSESIKSREKIQKALWAAIDYNYSCTKPFSDQFIELLRRQRSVL